VTFEMFPALGENKFIVQIIYKAEQVSKLNTKQTTVTRIQNQVNATPIKRNP